MRLDYFLYPEGRQKLEDSGIAARIRKMKLPDYGSHWMRDDIMATDREMRMKGLYDTQPDDFSAEFKTHIFRLFVRPENYHWRVSRGTQTKEECDEKDILLFTGEPASHVLKKDELWDHQRFGFNSPLDLVSCVAALMMESEEYRKAYEWVREVDGVKTLTRITGDGNADFRVHQRDITPYPTLDPLRKPILMRPVTANDKRWISGHDSTEPYFLVTVLKYLEQKGITTSYQEDPKAFMEWAKGMGQSGGSTTEHLSPNFRSPNLYFTDFKYPIPDFPAEYTRYSISTTGDGSYGAYIDGDDLVFSYHMFRKDPEVIEMRFHPSDADHLVRGIVYQCAHGLGRTSAAQVLAILEHSQSQ